MTLLFAIAHAFQLQDGMCAIRSPELPECEARGPEFQPVKEQFGEALRHRVLEMVEAGEMPPLYPFEELEPRFRIHAQSQIPAPDRLPGTFDTVITVRIKVPDDIAKRIMAMRAVPRDALRTDAFVRHEDVPANADNSARQTVAGTRDVTNDTSPDGNPPVIAEIEELLGMHGTQGENDQSGPGEAQADHSATPSTILEPGPEIHTPLDPSVRLRAVARRLLEWNRG
jgi:hypothetical protein